MSTKDLSKDGLRRLIQGNLDFLCRQIEGTVANQWACVILLLQFIEYLLKYRIQSYENGFGTCRPRHDLKKLYKLLEDNDQRETEACFDKLRAHNKQRDPKSFDTIKEFVALSIA